MCSGCLFFHFLHLQSWNNNSQLPHRIAVITQRDNAVEFLVQWLAHSHLREILLLLVFHYYTFIILLLLNLCMSMCWPASLPTQGCINFFQLCVYLITFLITKSNNNNIYCFSLYRAFLYFISSSLQQSEPDTISSTSL